MSLLKGHSQYNLQTVPTFFGYISNGNIIGVNSGHATTEGYRSRGLWVHPQHRKQGIGQQLLLKTILQAKKENADLIWSYPRKTSWTTYESAGFELVSDWAVSETSSSNAFCVKKIS